MKLLLIAALLLAGCARQTVEIGSTKVENRTVCVEKSRQYNFHKKKYEDQCHRYGCQEVTTQLGKYWWEDKTLDVKDLYSGTCQK